MNLALPSQFLHFYIYKHIQQNKQLSFYLSLQLCDKEKREGLVALMSEQNPYNPNTK